MAPPPQNTPITPALEARFRVLADAQPPKLNAEIQSHLQQNPPIDPKVYYGWLVQYLSAQAEKELLSDPITSAEMIELLRQTKYDDPESMGRLIYSLNSITGVAAIPLGSYMPPDGKKQFCFLQPQLGLLPRDFEPSPSRGDAVVTQARCWPRVPSIPEFFLEIGQLHVTTSATATVNETNNTAFWLVVAPDRTVSAFWNPLGSDPQNQSIYSPYEDIYPPFEDMYRPYEDMYRPYAGNIAALHHRPVAGQFPGFTNQCTAVSFHLTIDELLQTDQAKSTLTIGATNFLNLPMHGRIIFGGVDSGGWRQLDRISSQFAAVPSYAARPAAYS